MPPAVIAIGAAVASAAVSIFVSSAVLAAVLTLAITVAATLLTRKPKQDQAQAEQGSLGRELTIKLDPMLPRQVAVGRTATGGSVVWAFTYGNLPNTPRPYLVRIIALSDYPIEGVIEVYDGNDKLTFEGDINTGFRAANGYRTKDGTPCVHLQVYPGDPDGSFSTLVQGMNPRWDASHKGKNIAYAVLRSRQDQDGLPNGEPRLTFVMDGARVYDGRDVSQDKEDPSTWKFSRNAAVIASQLLRGLHTNDQLIVGVGAEDRDLNQDQVNAAANVCDEPVIGEDGEYYPRYRAGMMVGANETAATWLADLELAMDGHIFDRGGQISILPGGIRTPVFHITDDDIVVSAPKSWQPNAGQSETVNFVTCTYLDSEEKWTEVAVPPQQNLTWEDDDGGERFTLALALRAVSDKNQAIRIARRAHQSSRYSGITVFVLPIWALELEQGDWFQYTSERFDLDAVYFEALKVDITKDLNVAVVARVTSPLIDDWGQVYDVPRTDQTWNEIAFDLPLPDISASAWHPVDEEALVEQFGIQVTFSNTLFGRLLTNYELQWAYWGTKDTEQFSVPLLPAVDQVHIISGLKPDYAYAVRARSLIGNRESEWTDWILVNTEAAEYPGSSSGVGAWTPIMDGFIRSGNDYTIKDSYKGVKWASLRSAGLMFNPTISWDYTSLDDEVFIGLSMTPDAGGVDNDETSLQYGIYFNGAGNYYIVTDGVKAGPYAASVDDNYVITQVDNSLVLHINGELKKEWALPTYDQFYLDVGGYASAGQDWKLENLEVTQSETSAVWKDIKFIRSAPKPATPTTAEAPGWSDSIPNGTLTLWATTAMKTITGRLLTQWSSPEMISIQQVPEPYDPTKTYYKYQVVTFNGGTYILVVDSSVGNAPSGTGEPNAWWDVIVGFTLPGDSTGELTTTINIPATTGMVNLRTLANENGYSGNDDANLTFVVQGHVIGLPGTTAIDTGSWPTGKTIDLTLEIESGKEVRGGGGTGGGQSQNGGKAGHAIFVRHPITITNNGTIKGGGGGGAGGKPWSLSDTNVGYWKFDEEEYLSEKAGGAGGGGYPNGPSGGAGATAGSISGGGSGGTGEKYPNTAAGDGGDAGQDGEDVGTFQGGKAGYAVKTNGFAVDGTMGAYIGTWGA